MNGTLRKLLYVGFAALLVTSAAARTFAQSTGVIRGTITDPSKAAIQGASVIATDTNTGILRTIDSNERGIFVFPDLPIGTYALKISAKGFETQNRPALSLLTGQVIDLSIGLSVGSQTQEISVTSETQQIETSTSTVAQSVDPNDSATINGVTAVASGIVTAFKAPPPVSPAGTSGS